MVWFRVQFGVSGWAYSVGVALESRVWFRV